HGTGPFDFAQGRLSRRTRFAPFLNLLSRPSRWSGMAVQEYARRTIGDRAGSEARNHFIRLRHE
ncbi:MAG: hypothetical protein WA826_17875, partial [Silvibacterium sp.]